MIRADQLAEYIRKIDADPNAVVSSEKDMETLSQFFLSIHQQPKIDYVAKFREGCNTETALAEETESAAVPAAIGDPAVILCPKCGAPMILRKAMKGPSAGKEFYGCASFPKCRGIVQVQ